METQLPFRHYVIDTPVSNIKDREKKAKTLSILSDWKDSSEVDYEWLKKQDDEGFLHFVAILDAKQFIYSTPDVVSFKKWLCKKSLELAKESDVIWTPLIDKLVRSRSWSSAAIHQSRRYGEHKDSEDDLPDAIKVAFELIPWLKEQKSADNIHSLLDFEAEEIHVVVARYSPILADGIFERLLEKPGIADSLSGNPNLTPKQRTTLFKTVIERDIKGRKKGDSLPRAGLAALEELAKWEPGVPPKIKEYWIRGEQRRAKNRVWVLKTLANDCSLSEKDAGRIYKYMLPGIRAPFLTRQVLSAEDEEDALKGSMPTAEVLVNEYSRKATPRHLELIAKYHSRQTGLMLKLIEVEEMTPKGFEVLASAYPEQRVQAALLREDILEKAPKILEILEDSKFVEVVAKVLRASKDAESYSRAFARLAELSAYDAVVCATNYPPPEGTVVSQETLQQILQVQPREVRLKAIELTSALSSATQEIPAPTQDSGSLKPDDESTQRDLFGSKEPSRQRR